MTTAPHVITPPTLENHRRAAAAFRKLSGGGDLTPEETDALYDFALHPAPDRRTAARQTIRDLLNQPRIQARPHQALLLIKTLLRSAAYDGDDETRRDAVAALDRLSVAGNDEPRRGVVAVLNGLSAAGNDESRASVIAALQPYAHYPDVRECFRRALQKPPFAYVPPSTLSTLDAVLAADPRMLDELLPLLAAHPGNSFAEIAAVIAPYVAAPELRSIVSRHFQGENPKVHTLLARAMALKAHDPEIRTMLIPTLQTNPIYGVVRALAPYAGDDNILKVFCERVRQKNYTPESFEIEALASHVERPEAQDALQDVLYRPFYNRRCNVLAAQALLPMADDPAEREKLLTRIAGDRYAYDWFQGPYLDLYDLSPQLQARWLERLSGASSLERHVAARTLAPFVRRPEVREAVAQKLHDPSGIVRDAAAMALADVADHPAVKPLLLQALNDPAAAAAAAAALKPHVAHPDVYAAFRRVGADPDSPAARTAAAALASILTPPPPPPDEIQTIRRQWRPHLASKSTQIANAARCILAGHTDDPDIRAQMLAALSNLELDARAGVLRPLLPGLNPDVIQTLTAHPIAPQSGQERREQFLKICAALNDAATPATRLAVALALVRLIGPKGAAEVFRVADSQCFSLRRRVFHDLDAPGPKHDARFAHHTPPTRMNREPHPPKLPTPTFF